MTWAQRLKRVFKLDIETCRDCGGEVRIISCIKDPAVIRKILAHYENRCFWIGLRLDQEVMNVHPVGRLQNDIFLIRVCLVVRSLVNRKKCIVKRTPSHQT